jgi:hypothetical protein
LGRLPANELEQLVSARIKEFLRSPQELYAALTEAGVSGNQLKSLLDTAQQLAQTWSECSAAQLARRLKLLLKKVVLTGKELEIQLDLAELAALLKDPACTESLAPKLQLNQLEPLFSLTCSFQPFHRRGELRLILPTSPSVANRSQQSIFRALARALQWKDRIIAGDVYCREQLAQETGLNSAYVGRILRLGALSPKLVEAVCCERGLVERPLEWFVNRLPLDWTHQKPLLEGP